MIRLFRRAASSVAPTNRVAAHIPTQQSGSPPPWTGTFEFEHPSTPHSRIADMLDKVRALTDTEFAALVEMVLAMPGRRSRARGVDEDAAALKQVRDLVTTIWHDG